ncbi:unnamed protein product [Vitrella brassicaformis CCMP3155]|uniref:Cyclic nucleotide-binding domain-containing protein n=2 Tax=Vitrella brassicaformis TaxID=1169539 RepID=A0A0G4GGB3_VITBC|nr:unnamed protein product [Vitrella brassicaformis CCMP3155]|eukprot:CEM28664.1 unnamed protein product [Vitrella brassicaformis CCMP3155]
MDGKSSADAVPIGVEILLPSRPPVRKVTDLLQWDADATFLDMLSKLKMSEDKPSDGSGSDHIRVELDASSSDEDGLHVVCKVAVKVSRSISSDKDEREESARFPPLAHGSHAGGPMRAHAWPFQWFDVCIGAKLRQTVLSLDARFIRYTAADNHTPSISDNAPSGDTSRTMMEDVQLHHPELSDINEEAVHKHSYGRHTHTMGSMATMASLPEIYGAASPSPYQQAAYTSMAFGSGSTLSIGTMTPPVGYHGMTLQPMPTHKLSSEKRRLTFNIEESSGDEGSSDEGNHPAGQRAEKGDTSGPATDQDNEKKTKSPSRLFSDLRLRYSQSGGRLTTALAADDDERKRALPPLILVPEKRMPWDICCLLVIFYQTIFIPFDLAFGIDGTRYAYVFLILHHCFDVLWVVDICLNFFSRLLRILKFRNIVNRLQDFLFDTTFVDFKFFPLVVESFEIAFLMIVVAHWNACIFYMVGTQRAVTAADLGRELQDGTLGSGDLTWVEYYELDAANLFSQYVAALYWSLTTLSTVGYGDFVPQTRNERLYLRLRRVPYELQSRIKRFLAYKFESEQTTQMEGALSCLLTDSLKNEVAYDVYHTTLRAFPLFESVKRQVMTQLCRICKCRIMARGDVLLNEGVISRSMFFLTKGRMIATSRNNAQEGEDGEYDCDDALCSPSFFGAKSLFEDHVMRVTLKCATFCDLVEIERGDLLSVVMMFPKLQRKYVTIAEQVRVGDYRSLEVRCSYCGPARHRTEDCPYRVSSFLPHNHCKTKRSLFSVHRSCMRRCCPCLWGNKSSRKKTREFPVSFSTEGLDQMEHEACDKDAPMEQQSNEDSTTANPTPINHSPPSRFSMSGQGGSSAVMCRIDENEVSLDTISEKGSPLTSRPATFARRKSASSSDLLADKSHRSKARTRHGERKGREKEYRMDKEEGEVSGSIDDLRNNRQTVTEPSHGEARPRSKGQSGSFLFRTSNSGVSQRSRASKDSRRAPSTASTGHWSPARVKAKLQLMRRPFDGRARRASYPRTSDGPPSPMVVRRHQVRRSQSLYEPCEPSEMAVQAAMMAASSLTQMPSGICSNVPMGSCFPMSASPIPGFFPHAGQYPYPALTHASLPYQHYRRASVASPSPSGVSRHMMPVLAHTPLQPFMVPPQHGVLHGGLTPQDTIESVERFQSDNEMIESEPSLQQRNGQQGDDHGGRRGVHRAASTTELDKRRPSDREAQ